MNSPPLEELLNYLSECPSLFLESPLPFPSHSRSKVHSLAIVKDLFIFQEVKIPGELASRLEERWENWEIGHWQGLQVLAYLYSHPWFHGKEVLGPGFSRGYDHMNRLVRLVSPPQMIGNPARREELCRLALHWCGLFPRGETPSEGEDRLKALDTLYRAELEEQSRQAHSRAEEIKRKMREKRAREAANTYGRE